MTRSSTANRRCTSSTSTTSSTTLRTTRTSGPGSRQKLGRAGPGAGLGGWRNAHPAHVRAGTALAACATSAPGLGEAPSPGQPA
jgi:hypothetical protein